MRRSPGHLRGLALVTVAALALAACNNGDDTGDGTGAEPPDSEGVQATGEPLKIGLINQENTPAGSFPELSVAAQAAVDYSNNELDGFGGRPVDLVVCTTTSTPESSQACANEMVEADVEVVVDGIDLALASAYPVLDEAGIPVVGLTPATTTDYTAPNAYFLGGGALAVMLGQIKFAKEELDAETAVVLIDASPVGQAAQSLIQTAADNAGLEISFVSEEADAPDFTPAVTTADDEDADVWLVLHNVPACGGIWKARQSLGIDTPLVTLEICSERELLDSVGGAAEDSYFGGGLDTERPEDDPEVAIFREKLAQYAGEDADYLGTAATGFIDIMTVKSLFDDLAEQGLELTSENFSEYVASVESYHMFMGPEIGPCGQVSIFPAVCDTQVWFTQYVDGAFVDAGPGWMDGADLL